MKGARCRKKSGLCTSGHVQHTINRAINFLVALYNVLLNYLSQLLISKPHTKSSNALDYMNIV